MIDWDIVQGEIITVISDIHSNKIALKTALEEIKQSNQIIILGDILTYGVDVVEVTDMIDELIIKGAWLLIGNHDQMYMDLIQNGRCEILNMLRPEIQESVKYTIDKLDTKKFMSWNWKKEIVYNDILFSHANPYGNFWEYVKSEEDFRKAAKTIQKLGHLAGVFGHTHRSNIYSLTNKYLPETNGISNDVFVINPGSVGQPRNGLFRSSILRLSSHKKKLWAEIKPIQYDEKEHIKSIMLSSLSDQSKMKLSMFFKGE